MLSGDAELRRAWAPTGLQPVRGDRDATPRPGGRSDGCCEPLDEARAALHRADDPGSATSGRRPGAAALVLAALRGSRARPTGRWSARDWAGLIGRIGSRQFRRLARADRVRGARPFLLAWPTCSAGSPRSQRIGALPPPVPGRAVFGKDAVDDATGQAAAVWPAGATAPDPRSGRSAARRHRPRRCWSTAARGCTTWTSEAFARLEAHPATRQRPLPRRRCTASTGPAPQLGYCRPPAAPRGATRPAGHPAAPERWAGMRRTLVRDLDPDPERPRRSCRTIVAKAGRWLAAEHPEITDPAALDPADLCAAWVAAVDRMRVGDYVAADRPASRERGRQAHRPAHQSTPADLRCPDVLPRPAGMGVDPAPVRPAPRPGASAQHRRAHRHRPAGDRRDIWAKLLWAGLNLDRRRPAPTDGGYYPLRADPRDHADLAVRRAAQRRDHPAAGRVHPLAARRAAQWPPTRPRSSPEQAVCLLDVPVHKTGTAFTKPVDPLLGQAIEAWQAARPDQPEHAGPQDRANRSTCCSAFRAQPVAKRLHQPRDDPDAVRQGRGAHRRRPRENHQPPGPLHDRHPALQRQGADDAVRAASLARAPQPRHHPALREDHPEHADQGLHRRRLLRAATSAPSRSSWTATPSPPVKPQPASPGSTTTSATNAVASVTEASPG